MPSNIRAQWNARNRLRVGVRAQNASVSGFTRRPFSGLQLQLSFWDSNLLMQLHLPNHFSALSAHTPIICKFRGVKIHPLDLGGGVS